MTEREYDSDSTSGDDTASRVNWGIVTILAIVAVTYILRGSYHLLSEHTEAIDLRQRWEEQHFVLSGATWEANHPGAATAATEERLDPKKFRYWNSHLVATPTNGGYPLWAFVPGTLLYGPDWPSVRYWFAALNAIALIVIVLWATRTSRILSPSSRAVVVMTVLAMNSVMRTLSIGQVSLIIMALLVAIMTRWQRRTAGSAILSGLLLGVAMSKPSVSIPFVLPFLVGKRFISLGTFAIYITLATAIVWAGTGVSPARMVHSIKKAAEHSVVNNLDAGIPAVVDRKLEQPENTLVSIGVVVLTLGAIAVFLFRHKSIFLQFAIAAVTSRLWTYHNHCDDIVLVFLVIPVLCQHFSAPTWPSTTVSALLVVSLCMPSRIANIDSISALQILIWVSSLIWLMFVQRGAVARQEQNGECPVVLPLSHSQASCAS